MISIKSLAKIETDADSLNETAGTSDAFRERDEKGQVRHVTFIVGGGTRLVIRNRSLEEIANCVWAPERESR